MGSIRKAILWQRESMLMTAQKYGCLLLPANIMIKRQRHWERNSGLLMLRIKSAKIFWNKSESTSENQNEVSTQTVVSHGIIQISSKTWSWSIRIMRSSWSIIRRPENTRLTVSSAVRWRNRRMSTYGLFTGKGNGKMYIKNMISNKRSYAARTVALVLFMFCIAFGMAHFNPVMADAKTAVKRLKWRLRPRAASDTVYLAPFIWKTCRILWLSVSV